MVAELPDRRFAEPADSCETPGGAAPPGQSFLRIDRLDTMTRAGVYRSRCPGTSSARAGQSLAGRERRRPVEQNSRRSAAVVLALVAPALGLAQTGEMRALADAFRLSQEELRRYSWTERSSVVVDGAMRGTMLSRVRCDADGMFVEIPAGPQAQGGSPSLQRSAKKHKKVAELDRGLRELIAAYTRFTPQQMREVFARASIFPLAGESAGLIRVEARNVVRQGDRMMIWADSLTHRARRFEIVTSREGKPVNVVTEFQDLPDGPTHPARTVVRTESRGKPLVITTERFDHVREGG